MTLFFDLAASAAVAFALGVVCLRGPVHVVLCLVGTLLCQAVLFILLGADFLAGATVFVYAGGVMVLFLFVVMLLGGRAEMGRHRGAGGIAAGLACVGLFALPLWYGFGASGSMRPGGGGPKALASPILQTHALAFEAASVLILAALVAALVGVRRTGGTGKGEG